MLDLLHSADHWLILSRNLILHSDRVALVKKSKYCFVPVNEDGIPKTDEGKIVVVKQNRAAEKAKRKPMRDYCMVYLPPFYRLRFWIFAVVFWGYIGLSMIMAFILPLLVGRGTIALLTKTKQHDGYSLVSDFS